MNKGLLSGVTGVLIASLVAHGQAPPANRAANSWLGVGTRAASVDLSGNPGDSISSDGSLSANGRYVAFLSSASNLVVGDTNNSSDVFVRDVLMGTTQRVSVDSLGNQADAGSWSGGGISPSGRFVVFGSAAGNLVPADSNGLRDVFLRDLTLGRTERVSLTWNGGEANDHAYPEALSAGARHVVFSSYADNFVPSDTNGLQDVFVRDRLAGTTERVSTSSFGVEGNGVSQAATVSSDGRYIAFLSLADNLAPGDTNGRADVFLHDRATGLTTLVSTNSSGTQGNDSSYDAFLGPDGRHLAFASYASDLVAGDTNGQSDIFLKDLVTGAVTLESVKPNGDLGDGFSSSPSFSADLRYIGFLSGAANLVPGDHNFCSDGFVRDRLTGRIWAVSVDQNGFVGNDVSWAAIVSANGKRVVFASNSSSLVSGDNNQTQDVFTRSNLP